MYKGFDHKSLKEGGVLKYVIIYGSTLIKPYKFCESGMGINDFLFSNKK